MYYISSGNRLITPLVYRANILFRGFHGSCSRSRKLFHVNGFHDGCLRLFCSKSIRSTTICDDDDDGDFFGIKYFSADDIKGIDGLDPEKKKRLNDKVEEVKQLESLKASPEGFQRVTSFGQVRYDRENRVDYSGQFENDAKHILIEKRRKYMLELSLVKDINDGEKKEGGLSNLMEEQYFNGLKDSEEKSENKSVNNQDDNDEFNYIDYQYFKETYSPEMDSEGLPVGPVKFHFTPKWDEYSESLGPCDMKVVHDYRRSPGHLLTDLDNISFAGDSPLRSVEEVAHELMLLKERGSLIETEETEEIPEEDENDQYVPIEKDDSDAAKIEDIPKTALDYVMKIRQGDLQPEDKAYLSHLEEKFKKLGGEFKMKPVDERRESFDSSGKRNFLEQTPKLHLLRRDELVSYLASRLLFNERDLIAIDKPAGLIVEGGSANKKYPSLDSILPDLSKALFPKEEESNLYIVHRLDRDATGVLLLARSLSMVKTIRNLFAERKISKYYWAILKGVPDPPLGIIDIPIEAGTLDGIERMFLKPECDADFNRSMGTTRGALPATTHYRVIRKHGNACLVELKPEQGIKHQIRAHLGLGLRTPILGDHKYSFLKKIAPQKLPDDMLTKLNVRQTKVRNIPLHLHAKLYIIPGIGINGGSVSIPAHLPGYFRKNMSSLGLYKRSSVIKNPIAF